MIDDAISAISDTVAANGYTRVFYSAADGEGTLGTGIFRVSQQVRTYIVDTLRELERTSPT